MTVVPTLAILITYHEEGSLLSECIQSILSQHPANIEIIVYDDCSSVNPASRFVSSSAVKIVVGSQNMGPGFARNSLLKASNASYIHFHDADDLFAPDWYNQILSSISKNPDIILCDVLSFSSKGTVCGSVLGISSFHENLPDYLRLALNGSILVPSTVLRREIVVQSGGYLTQDDLPQSEDSDFHIRIAAFAKSIEFIQAPLVYQRIRSNSHSSLSRLACWQSAMSCIPRYLSIFPATVKPLIAQRASRLASILFVHGDIKCAMEGFRMARAFNASFEHRSFAFRIIARAFGQFVAEIISRPYLMLKDVKIDLLIRSFKTYCSANLSLSK